MIECSRCNHTFTDETLEKCPECQSIYISEVQEESSLDPNRLEKFHGDYSNSLTVTKKMNLMKKAKEVSEFQNPVQFSSNNFGRGFRT